MAIRYSFLVLGAFVASGRAAPAEPAPNPVVQIPDGQIQVPESPPDMVGYLLDGDDPEHPKPVAVPTWDSEATPTLTATVTIFDKVETVTIGPEETPVPLTTFTKPDGEEVECVKKEEGTGCVEGWEQPVAPESNGESPNPPSGADDQLGMEDQNAPPSEDNNENPPSEDDNQEPTPSEDDPSSPPPDDEEGPPPPDDEEGPPPPDDEEGPPPPDDEEGPPPPDDEEGPPPPDDEEGPPPPDDEEGPPPPDDEEGPPPPDDEEGPPPPDDEEGPPPPDDEEGSPPPEDNENPPPPEDDNDDGPGPLPVPGPIPPPGPPPGPNPPSNNNQPPDLLCTRDGISCEPPPGPDPNPPSDELPEDPENPEEENEEDEDEDEDEENEKCEARTLGPQPQFEVDQEVLDEILANQPEEGEEGGEGGEGGEGEEGEEGGEGGEEPPPEESTDEPPPNDVGKECETFNDCPECPDGGSKMCAGASTTPDEVKKTCSCTEPATSGGEADDCPDEVDPKCKSFTDYIDKKCGCSEPPENDEGGGGDLLDADDDGASDSNEERLKEGPIAGKKRGLYRKWFEA
ncbi:MAG: hypothetical protein LQ337_007662 [Flavoplaca oasis]|nr:MAG: hypothetical protein LQ337_007662 [Flavoplaca oasis]